VVIEKDTAKLSASAMIRPISTQQEQGKAQMVSQEEA
jgi:hypothetical protein